MKQRALRACAIIGLRLTANNQRPNLQTNAIVGRSVRQEDVIIATSGKAIVLGVGALRIRWETHFALTA